MREIFEIVNHCSATPEGRWHDVDDIRKWHLDRGFRDIGYHRVIYLDGTDHPGRPEEEIGAHVSGHNEGTLGVCYIGGTGASGAPKDTRTPEQKAGLERVHKEWLERYPTIEKISGHYQYSNKSCPNFDASAEYAHLLGQGNTVTLEDRIVHAFQWPSFNTYVRALEGSQELRSVRNGIYDTDVGDRAVWFCVVVDGQEMWIHEQDIV